MKKINNNIPRMKYTPKKSGFGKSKFADIAINLKRNKKIIIAVALAVILAVSVGFTIAYLIDSESVNNTFVVGKNTGTITETFNNSVKSDVYYTNDNNDDNVPVYVRAAIVVTWQDADGNVYAQKPVKDTDYTITGKDSKWVEKDGFYYYTEVLEKGASTPKLIGTCAPVADKAPEGYFLNVDISTESIQASGTTAEGTKAVVDAWGVDPSTLGSN